LTRIRRFGEGGESRGKEVKRKARGKRAGVLYFGKRCVHHDTNRGKKEKGKKRKVWGGENEG